MACPSFPFKESSMNINDYLEIHELAVIATERATRACLLIWLITGFVHCVQYEDILSSI